MKKLWIVTGAMVGVLIVGWSGPRVVQAESQGGGLPAVHEEVTALQATVASLETALTAERQARQAAEAALQKSVSSIQTDFASALNAESAARRAADAAIQSEIADILRRVSALESRATTVENLVTSLRLSMSFAELNIADIQRHLQATQLDGHVFTATGQDTPSLQNNEATVVSVVVPPGQYLIQAVVPIDNGDPDDQTGGCFLSTGPPPNSFPNGGDAELTLNGQGNFSTQGGHGLQVPLIGTATLTAETTISVRCFGFKWNIFFPTIVALKVGQIHF